MYIYYIIQMYNISPIESHRKYASKYICAYLNTDFLCFKKKYINLQR